MIVENVEPTDSAIAFTAPSTDTENIVLLSKKENCTHGTICSFPSVGILVSEQSMTGIDIVCWLVIFSHSLKERLPRIWTQPLSKVIHAMPLEKDMLRVISPCL
jgi:hypothetical protein